MSKSLDLSVVIPIQKEARYLPLAILDIDKKLSKSNHHSEIIAIINGDNKNSFTVLKNMAKTIKSLKILQNNEDNGVGQAVRQGVLLASGKFKLITSPDNSISIEHFNLMLPHFKKGIEVVVGNRTSDEGFFGRSWPIHKRITRKAVQLALKPFIPKEISDIHCCFKAFTSAAAEEIFTPLKSSSPNFHVEILRFIKNNGHSIVEIPVKVSVSTNYL